MAGYLIEFRFFGRTKHEIKNLVREVVHKCRLGRHHRPIPHITLVGPFHLKNPRDEENLISDFEELCAKQPMMTFKIKGFGTFDDTRVVYLNVVPDEALDKFRWEMSCRLQDYCIMSPYDLEKKFNFHSTIVMKLRPNNLQEVKKFVETLPEPEFSHYVVRVTLIKNQKILREYDFLLRRSLTRREAKNRRILSETYKRLEECIREDGLPLPESGPLVPIPELRLGEIEEGLFSRILNKIKKQKKEKSFSLAIFT